MDLPKESDHSTQESDSSVVQIVTQILVVILDFLRVLFFSVPILFKAFLNLLIPRKSKNVSGQLALVNADKSKKTVIWLTLVETFLSPTVDNRWSKRIGP